MKESFWQEYFSIPNIMGYFRIVLAILYVWAFYMSLDGAPYWPVIAIIVVSGLTDFFDGKIARKFHMVTDWGKMLDPIADKVTIGAIILSLVFKYKIMLPMIMLYIIKEGYMALAGMLLIKKGHKIEGAKIYGKVCTFATYLILLAILLIPNMSDGIVVRLVVINMMIMMYAFVRYIFHYGKLFKVCLEDVSDIESSNIEG